MEQTIIGRVIAILPKVSGTSANGKEWSRATIVIEQPSNDSKFTRKVVLSNLRNADEFGALEVGTLAKFYVDIESREYNGRWYTDVTCWKWEVTGAEAPQVQEAPQEAPSEAPQVQPQEAPSKVQQTIEALFPQAAPVTREVNEADVSDLPF